MPSYQLLPISLINPSYLIVIVVVVVVVVLYNLYSMK